MLRRFRCDLHIHTCLSPCGDLSMSPLAVVEKAISEKIDIIAICDHNASDNISYTIRAAAGRPIVVLPGMEVTSREEVHTLALFDKLTDLKMLQDLVNDHLPGLNEEKRFGSQVIVNEFDEVEGFSKSFLLGATTLPVADIVQHIHQFGGLAIASHIDRESFSIISQLGFIGPDLPFDALEVTRHTGLRNARSAYPELSDYPFLESSDAHNIRDIGCGITNIFLEKGTVREIKMAMNKEGGRFIEV